MLPYLQQITVFLSNISPTIYNQMMTFPKNYQFHVHIYLPSTKSFLLWPDFHILPLLHVSLHCNRNGSTMILPEVFITFLMKSIAHMTGILINRIFLHGSTHLLDLVLSVSKNVLRH